MVNGIVLLTTQVLYITSTALSIHTRTQSHQGQGLNMNTTLRLVDDQLYLLRKACNGHSNHVPGSVPRKLTETLLFLLFPPRFWAFSTHFYIFEKLIQTDTCKSCAQFEMISTFFFVSLHQLVLPQEILHLLMSFHWHF